MLNDERVRAVWNCELDRLELDVLRVERLVKGLATMPAEPWDPPAVPGQMPADLAERAQDLLDRQERAAADLRAGLLSAQRQLTYGDRVAELAASARPVYLDLEA
jgi:hypothetical protein